MTEDELKKTYVHQASGTEVKFTGRTADKELKTTKRRKNEGAVEVSITTLYEITPADPETGSWKKWVRLIELFEIK